MNGNRGQYTSSPLYNLKKQRGAQRPSAQLSETQGQSQNQGTRRYAGLSILMSVALPVLFLLSLFIPSNGLRWAFLIAAALALAAMWALGAFVQSARGTLTVIYTAMAVVVGLALFMDSQSDATRAATRAAQSQGSALLSTQTGGNIGALLPDAEPAETPVPEAGQEAVSAAQQQLEAFFAAYEAKNVPEMLKYCAPSWVNAQASPEEKLWQMLYGTYPVEYTIERMEGSEGNTSRIVTMKVRFSEVSGESLKRLQVVMVKVNDVWYVDPNSLGGVVIDEAAEAAAAQSGTTLTNINYTLAPATPVPNYSGVMVYYNERGGKYYHAKETCTAVDQQYWPLTGFYFDLINSQEYKHLLPCSKCNPPAR